MTFQWSKYVHDNLLSSFNDFFDELKPEYKEKVEEKEVPKEIEDIYIDEYPAIDEDFICKLKDLIGEELTNLLKNKEKSYAIRVKNLDNQISAVNFDVEKLRDFYESSTFSQKRALMFLFASPFHVINHLLNDYKQEQFQTNMDTYFFTKLPRIIMPFDELFGYFSLYDCLTNPFILDVQLRELNPNEISDENCEEILEEFAGVI